MQLNLMSEWRLGPSRCVFVVLARKIGSEATEIRLASDDDEK